jgi:CubicO group peptidase (beta-lactamase class C family)
MRSLILSVSTVASMLLTPSRAGAQSPTDTAWRTVQTLFRRYVAADSIVGATIVTTRHAAVTARDNIGMADRTLRQPITATPIFHWGSITKTLTNPRGVSSWWR